MHHYSSDTKRRKAVQYGLLALAVAAGWGLKSTVPTASPIVVGTLIVVLYAAFFESFDRWIWRTRLMQKLRIVDVPDLNGQWETSIKSSFTYLEREQKMRMNVRQTWSAMNVSVQTEDSVSNSVAACFRRNGDIVEFIYSFDNHPRIANLESVQKHSGTAWLKMSHDGKRFAGQYYTGRGRQNIGILKLARPLEKVAR